MHGYIKKHKTYIFLLLLLFICGFLRFYNLNWDQGNFFHPDERNIANAVVKIHFFDHLNPEFFAYGGFSIYLYRAASDGMAVITRNPAWIFDWGHIDLIGRFFSAFFSVITILPLFLLAKRLGNKQIALLACFLYSFCVSSIQIAHFGVTESLFVLTGILICLVSIKILEKQTLLQYIQCGVVCGIAAATKTTELAFLLFPITACLLNIIKPKGHAGKNIVFFMLLLVAGFVTFSLFSPYTFLAWNKFVESMHYEMGVTTGTLPVVYTYQFNNTLPYLFQIKNFFWQIGPVVVFSLIGIPLFAYQALKHRNGKLLIFLSFPLGYFLYAGSWHTKFIRYMAPMLPYLIIAASYVLYRLQRKFKTAGKIVVSIFSLLTMVWALAFFSIYTREQTRITASKWMYETIPSGAKLFGEHWDDGLPIPLPGYVPNVYDIEQLTIYEPDNQEKLTYYATKLAQGDYVIINSRRLYGTLIHLDKQYPLTSKYYKLLFNGNLGYEKVAEFTSYPSLFGVTINDDISEETFQVYDHPKVMVFKNVNRFSVTDFMRILATG